MDPTKIIFLLTPQGMEGRVNDLIEADLEFTKDQGHYIRHQLFVIGYRKNNTILSTIINGPSGPSAGSVNEYGYMLQF